MRAAWARCLGLCWWGVMEDRNNRDRPPRKTKPMSSSGAKRPSAPSGQQGKGSSKRRNAPPRAYKETSRPGRPQARSGQRAQQASAPAEVADSHPAKRPIPVINWWGTLIGLAALVYFIYQTITAGVNYISLFLTFAGLSLGAWLAVAWVAIQFIRLNYLLIIYLLVISAITLGFAAMSQPEPLVFFNAPISAAHGACTGSPAGWIFHGFRPGQCAGVASGRLGLVVDCGLAALIMAAVNQSIKWRVPYLINTRGRRRYLRNERRAWEYARREQTRPQMNELHRQFMARWRDLRDLKAYPLGSEESKRAIHELRQLDAEYGNKFKAMLRDIHINRKERRNERRQRREQWQYKYWLRKYTRYAADPNSIIPDSASPAEGRGTISKARKPTDQSLSSSSSSKGFSAPKITEGPVKHRSSFKGYYAFSYCVEHWIKHHDIYVYIDQAAPKRIIETAGRAALETVLKRGETPSRFFIDSSGKIIPNLFTSE